MPATQPNDLAIIVYAPALVGNDDRPLAIVRAMERASPGLRLEWTISDEGQFVPLPQRDAWVARGRSDGPGFPLVCNGGPEHEFVTWAANPQPPPRGLPALKRPWDIPSPELPHRLGWLNYWSAAAARAIGFPDPSCDAELLSRARRTSTGGWVVRLTDAPPDLDNPAHLDALLRAYERFPEIGGRATP